MDISRMNMTLAEKIEAAVRDIPANNPSYISFRQEKLSDVVSRELIKSIAQVAANIACADRRAPTDLSDG